MSKDGSMQPTRPVSCNLNDAFPFKAEEALADRHPHFEWFEQVIRGSVS